MLHLLTNHCNSVREPTKGQRNLRKYGNSSTKGPGGRLMPPDSVGAQNSPRFSVRSKDSWRREKIICFMHFVPIKRPNLPPEMTDNKGSWGKSVFSPLKFLRISDDRDSWRLRKSAFFTSETHLLQKTEIFTSKLKSFGTEDSCRWCVWDWQTHSHNLGPLVLSYDCLLCVTDVR